MSKYVRITQADMDDFLKSEKGWRRNVTGNEYVYDFHLAKLPIIVKVASSIRIDDKRARNKGSDAIRVFAVTKAGLGEDAKVTGGLCKAKRVYRVEGWKNNLKKAVMDMINKSKYVYIKFRR